MAPEALKYEIVPFKSDIYSLGIILHFLITKTLPDMNENGEPVIKLLPKYSEDISFIL